MTRVLIVDDDPGFRELLGRLCQGEGLEPVAVATVDEALYALEKHPFALAIVDLCLPGASGAELAWKIRRRDGELPLMALSGHLDEWDTDDLRDLGFRRILSKPAELTDLRCAVRELILRPSQGAAEA